MKSLALFLLLSTFATAQALFVTTSAPSNPCDGSLFEINSTNADMYWCNGTSWATIYAVPPGTISVITSGTCGTGWSEVTALDGKMLRGTLAAHGDVGNTGGSATIIPAGTISTSSQTNFVTIAGNTPADVTATLTFTGSAFDPSPSYKKVIFCSKN